MDHADLSLSYRKGMVKSLVRSALREVRGEGEPEGATPATERQIAILTGLEMTSTEGRRLRNRCVRLHRDRLRAHREPELARVDLAGTCLLYTSPSPRDGLLSRMPSSA